MQSSEDLTLLSCRYLWNDLPSDKWWLKNYFNQEILLEYLHYHFCFYEILIKRMPCNKYCQLFLDHTGYFYDLSDIAKLCKLVTKLENLLKEAEKKRDLNLVAELKSGKFDLGLIQTFKKFKGKSRNQED